jgi:type I restriction enzyme, S subunit
MKLGDILTLRKGNTIEIQDSETYRISGVQNYGKGVIVRREVKGAELTMRQYQVIEPNQLMWCKVDTKNGAFGITHSEHTGTLASPNMALADINLEKADPSFLETLFRVQSFADYITHLSSGTTNRKYLTPRELLKQVTLPDWGPPQQRAFVSKLRQIEECGLAREITHQQSLLAKLKQAILQEAIQGKLTADWRAAHPDMEPASQLLHRIQAEKARLIAAKKLRPEKPLPKITPAEIPFEIPKGWEWCRMGEAGVFQRGKSKHRPRNDPRLFDNGDIPFVQTGDVARSKRNGFMIETSTGYYNEVGLAQSRLWPDGTMCITIAANIAETGFLTFPACIPDSVVAFTPAIEGKTPQFLRMFIELTRTAIEQFAPATAQKNINLEIINELMLPLPPLAEQAAIVSRVEALTTTCRALEAEIEHARTHAAHLLQAVLKEAFAPASS